MTLQAGETKKLTVQFTPPLGANATLFPIYSGYITVTPKHSVTPAARISYAGLVGNWSSAAIWSTNSPSMFYANGAVEYVFNPTFEAISIGSTGIYNVSSHLPIQENAQVYSSTGLIISAIAATTSEFAYIRVVDAKGQSYIVAADYSYSYSYSNIPLVFSPLQRMSPNAFQSISSPLYFSWKGFVFEGNQTVLLPSGTYQIAFDALKHFADVNGPLEEALHTIVSPKFRLVAG